jgi:hypothetical protein
MDISAEVPNKFRLSLLIQNKRQHFDWAGAAGCCGPGVGVRGGKILRSGSLSVSK